MTSWDLMEKLQMNRNVAQSFKNNLAAAAQLIGQDEEPLFGMFCGFIERGNSKTLYDGALLVTSSRLIVCGKTSIMLSTPSVGTIAIENVSSVNPSTGLLLGSIIIETLGNDDIRLENLDKQSINNYVTKIYTAIESAKAQKRNAASSINIQRSPADEIKKYKELLDSGIITQEEFDAKKKQLLGL